MNSRTHNGFSLPGFKLQQNLNWIPTDQEMTTVQCTYLPLMIYFSTLEKIKLKVNMVLIK
uniref:Uncharacterized protein n=1 Tax=Anguilla anguilla TaxID=7936 RepID=A0A0E9WCP2_ANGAN